MEDVDPASTDRWGRGERRSGGVARDVEWDTDTTEVKLSEGDLRAPASGSFVGSPTSAQERAPFGESHFRTDDNTALEVLINAARHGDVDNFNAEARKVSDAEMADVCRSKDVHRRTLLTAAVQSGSIEVVMAVSGFMERHNTHDQMVDVCRDRDAYSCTLLMTAVQSGAIEVMKVVSGLMATYLTSDQIAVVWRDTEAQIYTLLTKAVQNKNVKVVTAVSGVMSFCLTREQVFDVWMAKDRSGRTMLMIAVQSGIEEMITAALHSMNARSLITARQVFPLWMDKDVNGSTLLATAVQTQSPSVVRCVFDSMLQALWEDQLVADQAFDMWISKDAIGCTVVATAIHSGVADIVEMVLDSMRDTLTIDQFCDVCMANDVNNCTVLTAALRSDSLEVAKMVLDSITKLLRDDQLRVQLYSMFITADASGSTLLTAAARSGREDIVREVVSAFRSVIDALQKDQLRRDSNFAAFSLAYLSGRHAEFDGMWMTKDSSGSTVLAAAVESGSMGVITWVLKEMSNLQPDQVFDMLRARDASGSTLLMTAVRKSGSKEVLQLVLENEQIARMWDENDASGSTILLAAVQSGSTEILKWIIDQEQVARMWDEKDASGSTVLMAAVQSCNNEVLDLILEQEEQVGSMWHETDASGSTVLMAAVESGSEEVLDLILPQEEECHLWNIEDRYSTLLMTAVRSCSEEALELVVRSMEYVRTEEIADIWLSEDERGSTVLMAAGQRGSSGIFKTILRLMKQRISMDQVRDLWLSRDACGSTVLMAAVKSCSQEDLEAILELMVKDLSHDQAAYMWYSQNEGGSTVLMAAVQSGKHEVLGVVLRSMKSIRPKLSNDQVAHIWRTQDENGSTVLMAVVRSRSPNVLKAVLRSMMEDLSGDQVADIWRAQDLCGHTALNVAVQCGSKDVLEMVLGQISTAHDQLNDQIHVWMAEKGAGGSSLVTAAMRSDSTEVVGVVLNVIFSSSYIEEVDLPLLSDKFEEWWLHRRLQSAAEIIFDNRQVRYWSSHQAAHVWSTVLTAAAQNGGASVMEYVLKSRRLYFGYRKMLNTWMTKDTNGLTILAAAVATGKEETVEVLLCAMMRTLQNHELVHWDWLELCGHLDSDVVRVMRLKDSYSDNVMACAARRGNDRIMRAVWRTMRLTTEEEEIRRIITEPGAFDHCVLTYASMRKSREFFCRLVGFVVNRRSLHQMMDHYATAFGAENNQFGGGKPEADYYPIAQSRVVDDDVIIQDDALKELRPDYRLMVLSRLLEMDANVDEDHLQKLSRNRSVGWLKECLVGAVASARNPLIPGMTLSSILVKVACKSPEGDRKKLSEVQEGVDDLLLELFERLPQTVRGFDQGMSDCCVLLEPKTNPETTGADLETQGPLTTALNNREQLQTFCTIALLVDYLSHKFHRGLPELRDSGHILDDEAILQNLYLGDVGKVRGHSHVRLGSLDGVGLDVFGERNLNVDVHSLWSLLVASVTGTTKLLPNRGPFPEVQKLPGLTMLPGAQFIAAVVASNPVRYYRVPSLRMALDLFAYLVMLVVFSVSVLLHKEGALTSWEIGFAVYIAGAAWTEIQEMKLDIITYVKDRWNILDILALTLLAAGFLVRATDGDNPWGRALYALSAPLLFSRLVFFAQLLHFQGPMVQVLFGMARELFQFSMVMLVVILGFAMAFYALVRETDDVFGETYGETWLRVFKAMLGEVSIFEEAMDNNCKSTLEDDLADHDCNPYSPWITVLLVIYLIITSIMLLNLLVAVLTVQHQTVQENVDKEIKVSRIRVFEHYAGVVKNDTLPAPFNILQLAVSLPIGATASLLKNCWPTVGDLMDNGNFMYIAAKIAVGKLVFWPAMSVIVIVGGSLLWLCSLPSVILVVFTHVWRETEVETNFGRNPAKVGWKAAIWAFGSALLCTFLAPLFLFISWIWGILRGLSKVLRSCGGHRVDPNQTKAKDLGDDPKAIVEKWLGPLSVPLLREYVENPMSDPAVRQDERTRPTTVEHVKRLRTRLEQHIVQTVNANTDATIEQVAQAIKHVAQAIKKTDERLDKLQSTLERLVNRSQQGPALASLEYETKSD